MYRGLDNFSGNQLKMALDARMLSATTLSEISGISNSMISEIINDNRNPSYDTLSKLSVALNLPEVFFLKKFEINNNQVFYRKYSNATKKLRSSIDIKLIWLECIIEFLERFVGFPTLNLYESKLIKNKDFTSYSFDEIENLAGEVRAYWGVGEGVISNLTLLLENNGFFITRTEIGSDRLDGLFKFNRINNRAIIFLAKDKNSIVRSKFDLAHELGHAILHKNIDTKYYKIKEFHDLLEEQVNRFAGAFLLPSKSFTRDFTVPTLDTFLALKKKWNVSIAFMIVRAYQLELINERTYKNMWVNYSRKGWKKGEPFDNEIQNEKPTMLKKAFQLIQDNNLTSTKEIINTIGLSQNDIISLANLEKNFFSKFQEREVYPNLKLVK